MDRLLLTRGDDFGSFEEANRAIIDSFQRGLLRNASIMVPAPHFAHAAQLARQHPQLCLGLHLTLTSEWEEVRFGPVLGAAAVPSLVEPDGTFLPTPMHHHRRGVVIAEMMRELQAQLALARREGLRIRYLDEHMGIAWVHPPPDGSPRLVDHVRAWAKDEGLLWHTDYHMAPDVDQVVARPWTVERVAAALPRLAVGAQLWMLHPAYHDGPLRRLRLHGEPERDCSQEGARREEDARVLQSPAFARACQEHQVRCVSYLEAAQAQERSGRR